MCSLNGQLGDVSLTYIPVADYRGLEGCCTSGAVQFKLLKPIHIFNLYCNSFFKHLHFNALHDCDYDR